MMRDFKFFHGIIGYRLTGVFEPELNYNLNLYDELTEALGNEIRHEIDRNIIANLTGTGAGTGTYPLPLTGTINTPNSFTLTTTNTGTANYSTLTATNITNTNYTTTASDNLHYLNHFINLGGGNRA
jgi:hypothetical protein